MKKRNYLGTFVYYYNILNYVISDMLSQWDLAIDAKITFGKNILVYCPDHIFFYLLPIKDGILRICIEYLKI